MSDKERQSSSGATSGFLKILVGVDPESSNAARVIDFAMGLMKSAKTTQYFITSVSMINTSVKGNELDGEPANDDERKTIEKLRDLLTTKEGEHPSIEFKILHGDPAERICEYAEFAGCDLIVVGSRRHGELKRALLGSVSSSIVGKSKMSVLVVK